MEKNGGTEQESYAIVLFAFLTTDEGHNQVTRRFQAVIGEWWTRVTNWHQKWFWEDISGRPVPRAADIICHSSIGMLSKVFRMSWKR